MAAQDKLIPVAITLANSIRGRKVSRSSFTMSNARVSSKFYNPYTDAIQFFAGVYAKMLKIAGGDATWNQQFINNENLKALYVPNRNVHNLTLGMIVAASEEEWNELQVAISRSYNIVYPFDVTQNIPQMDVDNYNTLMGVFENGTNATEVLLAADGTNLGTFSQGMQWADAWNDLRVPYDAAQKITTSFIAPIYQPSGATKFYYTYTGARRWFGFQGWNLS